MKKHFYFLAAICMLFAVAMQVKAYDLQYRFYIPAAQGFVSESGYAMQWHYEGSSESQIAALTADPDASSWYQAIVSLSDYDYNPIQFSLLNASTAEAATESVACEYSSFGGYGLLGKKADGSHFLYFTTDEWSATYPNDYLPYNLQAHQGQDTLYVSWESNSDPNNWRVYVYDANDLEEEDGCKYSVRLFSYEFMSSEMHRLLFGDEYKAYVPTGVRLTDIEGKNNSSNDYRLDGTRMNKSQPGVYIRKGRKYVVK